MKQIGFILVLIVISLNSVWAQNSLNPAKGVYTMTVAGSKVTEESYSIENLPNDVIRHTAELSASGAKTVFVTTMKNNSPLEFLIETNGARALTASLANGEIKYNVTGQLEKNIKTEARVMFENLVWSQFIEILNLYEAARGGEQKIVAFLPSKALDLHLTLSRTGAQTIEINQQKIEIEKYHLVVAEGNLVSEIWASKNRVSLLIEVPAQQIKVVRQGFEELLKLSPATEADEKAAPQTFNSAFTSEEVSFNNGAVKLAGTLTLPKNNQKVFPGVIIISGSGGQDRDGSTLFNLYQNIAESLSQAGIAVLRVDDRGTGKSALPFNSETSYLDLINDSRAAFDYLSRRQEIDKTKIAFVGHSEGAETALKIASEDKRVAAIVLLAGASRPVNEIVLEQEMFQRASQNTINAADKTKMMPIAQMLMQQFEAAKDPKNAVNPKLAWFREHAASNPAFLAGQIACPVLIVQGEHDSLVLPAHAIALAKAFIAGGNKNVSLRILPDLTHLFAPVTGSKDATEKTSNELLQTLQTWANANLTQKP